MTERTQDVIENKSAAPKYEHQLGEKSQSGPAICSPPRRFRRQCKRQRGKRSQPRHRLTGDVPESDSGRFRVWNWLWFAFSSFPTLVAPALQRKPLAFSLDF